MPGRGPYHLSPGFSGCPKGLGGDVLAFERENEVLVGQTGKVVFRLVAAFDRHEHVAELVDVERPAGTPRDGRLHLVDHGCEPGIAPLHGEEQEPVADVVADGHPPLSLLKADGVLGELGDILRPEAAVERWHDKESVYPTHFEVKGH